MPDEKIDRKRPVEADTEPKPTQQRHVDDTVDDSFPASDPPAWTTTGSKSVAAQCEPDEEDNAPRPPGEGASDEEQGPAQRLVERASGLAQDLYRHGGSSIRDALQHVPEAERYYRDGTQAVGRSVQEHPLAAIVAASLVGGALGWLLASRRSGHASHHAGRPVYTPRARKSRQQWHPEPKEYVPARSRPFKARNEAEAASHTANSF